MAARGAGAAGGEAADHRVPGRGHAFGQSQWAAAFVQRLRELGWIEGALSRLSTAGRRDVSSAIAEIAAEFVRLKVDVIVTAEPHVALAAKQATSVIPIVFCDGRRPDRQRLLVASLARPGGNVTGLSNLGSDLAGKRLELLREVSPSLRRLAIMANVDYSAGVREMGRD